MRHLLPVLLLTFLPAIGHGAQLLVPMDDAQLDHLRAYGLVYWTLSEGEKGDWLLNYRGGSFLLPASQQVKDKARSLGVRIEANPSRAKIEKTIEKENMRIVPLEKAPKVAIYTPPGQDPWDDAVTLALDYAQIPFVKVWDKEVIAGDLSKYDWLHLHHEDFTGQYGKFYASFNDALWYRMKVKQFEALAQLLNYESVPELKKAVARGIKSYVDAGGFLFAMCSATDTLDIALAAESVDIVPQEIDRTPVDPHYAGKLDFSKTLAFHNFTIVTDPMTYEHSNIDLSSIRHRGAPPGFEDMDLFKFSAKYDPVPTMLTQNHTLRIPGFFGQTTSFNPDTVKPNVTVLGKVPNTGRIKYLHGRHGKGTFTLFGGHDPEDAQHIVGDPPTDLNLHKNSPGYRLILNNILFPAAKKMDRKT